MIAQGTGYVKPSHPRVHAHLREHIRYLEYRSGGQAREVFGNDRDQVSRREAMADIEHHSDRFVAYHKLVLSPSAEERGGIEDWQQWTRGVLHDLSERKHLELTWYAVYHDNTDDPHVHVIVAGAGVKDNGETATLKLYASDFRALEGYGRDRAEVEHLRLARDAIGLDERIEAHELGIAVPARNQDTDHPGGSDRPTIGEDMETMVEEESAIENQEQQGTRSPFPITRVLHAVGDPIRDIDR
jgi:hypothetical protein